KRLFFAPEFTAPSDGLTSGDIIVGYYSDSPELHSDTDSCNLLTIAPDLLLYMAMKHACIFVQDDEAAQKYGFMAEAALQVVQKQADKTEYSGSPLVIPNVLDNSTMRTHINFGVIRH
ncbi:phage adaptor protein, partial [Herbiconiux daphne]